MCQLAYIVFHYAKCVRIRYVYNENGCYRNGNISAAADKEGPLLPLDWDNFKMVVERTASKSGQY